jgi:hypothetical protein
MGWRGIDVRQSGDRLVVRASLKDSAGARVATGTANLRLFEVQSDGTLKSYDFNDNTFKTTALTTATQALTHRQGDNNTYNTGVWTHALTTVSGFTRGNVYIVQVAHTSASPAEQEREFQYGEGEGDFTVSTTGGVTLASDFYHADIQFTRDQANTQDEWTVTWFKNGVRQTSGITSPTLQGVKRADGTDLFVATAMTQVGSTGTYKLDRTTTERITVGEAVLAVASATIDGSARTFSRLISRDST